MRRADGGQPLAVDQKRLKRAQFFDQREQMVAAGLAVPVEADAGLPDPLVDPAERDLEAPTAPE